MPINSSGAVIGTLSAERRMAESSYRAETVLADDRRVLERTASLIAE